MSSLVFEKSKATFPLLEVSHVLESFREIIWLNKLNKYKSLWQSFDFEIFGTLQVGQGSTILIGNIYLLIGNQTFGP